MRVFVKITLYCKIVNPSTIPALKSGALSLDFARDHDPEPAEGLRVNSKAAPFSPALKGRGLGAVE
jgi:hypothetical protein